MEDKDDWIPAHHQGTGLGSPTTVTSDRGTPFLQFTTANQFTPIAEAETELEPALATLLGAFIAAVLNPTRNFISRIPGMNTTRNIRVSTHSIGEDVDSPIHSRTIFQTEDAPRPTHLSIRAVITRGKQTFIEI